MIDFVKESGGIEYANKAMNKFHEDALQILRGLSRINLQAIADPACSVYDRQE